MGGLEIADLATLSTVKSYIQPDTDEDDGILQTLLKWASSEIRDFTERLFTKPPVTEERALYFRGTRSMRLDDPLATVTKIVAPIAHYVDGEPYPFERELVPDEYEIRSRPTGTTLLLDSPGNGKFLVTGTWGWSTVPGAIEAATVTTVDEWYRGNILPPTGTREEGGGEGKNIYLPREVQETLQRYVLKEYVA